jgi:hypothetical protein
MAKLEAMATSPMAAAAAAAMERIRDVFTMVLLEGGVRHGPASPPLRCGDGDRTL